MKLNDGYNLALGGAIGLLVAAIVVASIMVGGGFARPTLYQLPEEFAGWVAVRHLDPACPPLRERGLFRAVLVDTQGQACTSESFPRGWTRWEWEHVGRDGKVRKIRGEDVHALSGGAQGDIEAPTQEFFVGKRDELEASWRNQTKLVPEPPKVIVGGKVYVAFSEI